ncbi:hypothetical protein [Corallococcus sp. RDP092CA]
MATLTPDEAELDKLLRSLGTELRTLRAESRSQRDDLERLQRRG